MENEIRERISEVLDVLNHTQKDFIDRIPEKFMTFLKNNALSDYEVRIDYENEKWIELLPNDTVEILSMIYRDYIVDDKTREKLIAEEQSIIRELKKKQNEQYNYDNLFERNKNVDSYDKEKNENTQNLVPIDEKKSWFNKILKKIKYFFKRGEE